jgi:hypothetical protein
VTFSGATSNGFTGTLDRGSGQMSIRSLSEREQAKFDESGEAELGMWADLKCSATQLF